MTRRAIHLGLEPYANPVWIPGSDGLLKSVAPDELPVSNALRRELMQWASDFDEVFERMEHSFRPESAEAEALEHTGLELWQRTVEELGDEYEVHYDSPIHGESYRVSERTQ